MRKTLWAVALVVTCGAGLPTTSANSGGSATISLSSANATMTQTSDTAWTLEKTGEVTRSTATVTWTVTASNGTTIAGQLLVSGTMTVTNTGTDGATIGNIVVNLQTKSGSAWVTRTSDIADATGDDAATSATFVAAASSENRSTFSETPASGRLLFMDANTNTIFSLVPQKTIAPNTTVALLFSASFDLYPTTNSLNGAFASGGVAVFA